MLQEIFENYRLALRLSLPFFVELVEIFGVLQDLIQELAMACFFASFLPRAHGLLKPIKGPRLFFVLSVGFGSTVELTVNQLSLVHNIAQGLDSILVECHLVGHVVGQYFRPEFLLKLVDLEALQICLSNLFFTFVCEVVFVNQFLQIRCEKFGLIDLVEIFNLLHLIGMVHGGHVDGGFPQFIRVWVVQLHVDVPQQVVRGQQVIVSDFLVVDFLSFFENCFTFGFPGNWVHQLDTLFQDWIQILIQCHFFEGFDLVV